MYKYLLFVAAALAATAGPASAQTLDATFTSPSSLYAPGYVYALGPQQADGKRLVAGYFTRVNGAGISSLVRLDAAGAVDAAFSQQVGAASNIYRVKGFANGQYLLGAEGGDIVAGGLTRTEVLRLNADGSADASFDAGTGPALAGSYAYGNDYTPQLDGKVLVAGYFTSFNGVAANGIVRLTANGSVDAGFSTGGGVGSSASSFVYGTAVAVQADGKVLLGGNFATFNGQAAYGLVRLAPTGSIDPAFGSVLTSGSRVSEVLVQPDGKVLVTGNLNTAAGPATLLRLNADGTRDNSFAPTYVAFPSFPGFGPLLVLQADGKLVVAGNPGSSQSSFARLNADGSLDTSFSFSVGYSAGFFALGVQADGKVLLGGIFNYFDTYEASLPRLNADGSVDTSFQPKLQSNGKVTAIVRQPDGKLLLGGNFSEYNGQVAHRVVRVSANGVLDADFLAATSVFPVPVNSLALQADGHIVAGTDAGVFRLLGTGQRDFSFPFNSPTSVSAVAVQPDGRILAAGGSYILPTGVPTNGVFRLLPTGGLDPTFTRQLDASAGTLTATNSLLLQPDGRIVVGSVFRGAGGQPIGRVVRYESTGAIDASFAQPALTQSGSDTYPYVLALAQQPDGKLLAGGGFDLANNIPQGGVARFTSTGTVDPAFNAFTPFRPSVSALAVQPNGRVLLGGSFTTPASHLARVLADGSPDASFGTTAAPNDLVRTLLVQPDGGIMLGGDFTTIGGKPAVGVARIMAPNVLAVAAPTATAARLGAWPVPTHGLLHVAPEAGAQQAELLDALGRRVRQQALAGAGEFVVDTQGLPAGVYVLRVRYASGSASRQVAVE